MPYMVIVKCRLIGLGVNDAGEYTSQPILSHCCCNGGRSSSFQEDLGHGHCIEVMRNHLLHECDNPIRNVCAGLAEHLRLRLAIDCLHTLLKVCVQCAAQELLSAALSTRANVVLKVEALCATCPINTSACRCQIQSHLCWICQGGAVSLSDCLAICILDDDFATHFGMNVAKNNRSLHHEICQPSLG